MAHDYNNALSVIIGFTEMAIDDVDPNGPLRANLDEVLAAANRAKDITQQLLAFARKQTIAPKVLDLNENVEVMLTMLRRLIGEDIDLVWLPGEPIYAMDGYHIVELIKFLQAEPSVNQDDLFRVEWAYVPLLDRHRGAAPQLLESRLANDPEFFCEVIQLIYRSKIEDQPPKEPTEESKAIATNAWRLLHEWKTPPGTQKDGTFSEERFTEWLQSVKAFCTESGHLEVALSNIGEVLIHTPPDPDGLWIY